MAAKTSQLGTDAKPAKVCSSNRPLAGTTTVDNSANGWLSPNAARAAAKTSGLPAACAANRSGLPYSPTANLPVPVRANSRVSHWVASCCTAAEPSLRLPSAWCTRCGRLSACTSSNRAGSTTVVVCSCSARVSKAPSRPVNWLARELSAKTGSVAWAFAGSGSSVGWAANSTTVDTGTAALPG